MANKNDESEAFPNGIRRIRALNRLVFTLFLCASTLFAESFDRSLLIKYRKILPVMNPQDDTAQFLRAWEEEEKAQRDETDSEYRRPKILCKDIAGFRESAELDFRNRYGYGKETEEYITKDSDCNNWGGVFLGGGGAAEIPQKYWILVPFRCERPVKTIKDASGNRISIRTLFRKEPKPTLSYEYDSYGKPCKKGWLAQGGKCSRKIEMPFQQPSRDELDFIHKNVPYSPRNFRTDDDVDFFINEYAKVFSTVFYENYAGSRDFPYEDQWSPYDKCCSHLRFNLIIQSTEGDIYHLEWCSFYNKREQRFHDYFVYKSKMERCSKDFYPQMVNTPPIFEYSPRIDFTPASPYCIYDIPQPE